MKFRVLKLFYFNTPPHSCNYMFNHLLSLIPGIFLSLVKLALLSPLVKMSAIISSDLQYPNFMVALATCSRTK